MILKETSFGLSLFLSFILLKTNYTFLSQLFTLNFPTFSKHYTLNSKLNTLFTIHFSLFLFYFFLRFCFVYMSEIH